MIERELLHNSIQCPDGTILVSRHQHDCHQHRQDDGRLYMVDGGLSYRRIQSSDGKHTDLAVYTDDNHCKIREYFEWGSNFDKEGNRLPNTIYRKLKDITGDHLIALIDWTKAGYPDKIHNVFKDELEWRLENNYE